MKWTELRKIAIKKGWKLVRQGSRHEIFRHPDKDFDLVLERHNSKEIKRGLFERLRKQLEF